MGAAVPAIISILTNIVPWVEMGSQAYQLVTAALDKIKAIRAQGRDPTDAEWADLDQQIAALHARLQQS